MSAAPDLGERLEGVIAQLRRLYLHVQGRGQLKPRDIGFQIELLEKIKVDLDRKKGAL